MYCIIPASFHNTSDGIKIETEELWIQLSTIITTYRKAWDRPLIELSDKGLLEIAKVSELDEARLKAITTPESGAWLNSAPVGVILVDELFRIAVGLRLVASIRIPHK